MAILSDTDKARLNEIKAHFDNLITQNAAHGISIQEAVNSIKRVMEQTITELGEDGKTSLIRSQKPIKMIHEAVKTSFIADGVNRTLIKPSLGNSAGELRIAGFLKKKDQDICLLPNNATSTSELLTDGLLAGETDNYGFDFTEKILSVNVRSQLSSLANNIDTLYERTFAEAMNLHMRCKNMVLGEVYMIPVYEYDKHQAQINNVAWIGNQSPIEKYLKAFSAINNRTLITSDEYKYEKVCLLIVDFSQAIPKIYNNDAELKADKLIPQNSIASINDLSFTNFTGNLLDAYSTRFGIGRFN